MIASLASDPITYWAIYCAQARERKEHPLSFSIVSFCFPFKAFLAWLWSFFSPLLSKGYIFLVYYIM